MIEQIAAPRKPSNNTNYSIKDAVLSAFSVFFKQCPSFLDNQRQMQSRKGQDNAQTLFEVEAIPCDNQLLVLSPDGVMQPITPINLGGKELGMTLNQLINEVAISLGIGYHQF